MLVFKKADLEFKQRSAYTAAPAHSLKSIGASTSHFLSRNTSQTSADAAVLPSSLPHAGVCKSGVVLDGLQLELDDYLCEPRAESFIRAGQGSGPDCDVIWCDPLRYWAARIFPRFNARFSLLDRMPRRSSHTYFDLRWISSWHRLLQLLANSSFPRARRRAPLTKTALIRTSWKHSKPSSFHSALKILTSPNMWRTHST
jgi:hypothetical protein